MVGVYFLEHVFKAAQYIMIDHSELNPLWSGIICSWDQQDGIAVHHAQVLVRWDPHYGFPLLHKYILISDIIAVRYSFYYYYDSMSLSLNWQVDWFEGIEIFDFIVHAIGQSTSPGCILAQEYKEDDDLAVWCPIIPNNTFLATLISLVHLHPSNYYTIHIPP